MSHTFIYCFTAIFPLLWLVRLPVGHVSMHALEYLCSGVVFGGKNTKIRKRIAKIDNTNLVDDYIYLESHQVDEFDSRHL